MEQSCLLFPLSILPSESASSELLGAVLKKAMNIQHHMRFHLLSNFEICFVCYFLTALLVANGKSSNDTNTQKIVTSFYVFSMQMTWNIVKRRGISLNTDIYTL